MPGRKRTNGRASTFAYDTVKLSHSVLGGLTDLTLKSRVTGKESGDEDGVYSLKIPLGEK